MIGGPFTVPLAEAGPLAAGLVGGKAATLGVLLRAGFPVPGGFVLTTHALAAALAQAGPPHPAPATPGAPDAADAEWVRRLALPEPVAHALAEAYAALGGGPVAVRSSAVGEDGAGRSFAGQYESVLDVVGTAALTDAVRHCWASAYAERVRGYSAGSTGSADSAGIAVLVQPMVAAHAAGVAFTANPVTGDRDECLVDAVRGLGDRLAAGTVTPESWSVRGGTARRVSADRAALSAPDAARVASVARRVAGLLGGPQDIEWALAGGAVTVLQARPITALPPVPQDGPAHDGPAQDGPAQDGPAQDGPAPDGFWLRGSYSLKPLSPMNVSTMLPAVNRGSPALFRYALGSRIEVRSVDGWSYVRFVQPGDPGEIQAKLTGIAAALRAGEPGRIVRRWLTRWEPVAVARLARMRAVDLAALPDRELASQVVRRLAFAERMQRLHFLVGGAATVEWGALGRFCRDLLGWDVARVLELVVGLPGKTTEPTVALAALVRAAGADPALTVLLTAETPPSVAAVARRNPGYAALLRDYLRGYGQRCLGADVAEPTMEERPGAMLRVVADALRTGRDPAEEIARAAAARIAAVDRAEAELARFPARVRAEFTALRARAEAAYPLRDDTAFFGHVAWGQFRAVLLVVGARLARRGRLEDGTDVFRLTVGEAVAALTDGADRRGLAASRAAQVAEAAVRGGPLTIGTPPGPPVRLDEAFAGLPAADRAELEVVRWADAAYRIGMARVEQQGAVLHGVGASAGRYVGPARILISEADFGKLRPGDVLVCPETTPQWSVLFSTVGALVTDTGGLLSHPAIIAREYRVPAVVATGNATGLLRDGQLVAVDGGTGRVEILTGDPPGAPASGSAAAASVAAATSAAVGGRAGGGPA